MIIPSKYDILIFPKERKYKEITRGCQGSESYLAFAESPESFGHFYMDTCADVQT